ncbi:hypothetical protein ACN47E_001361 [Coniothyrium glycines]
MSTDPSANLQLFSPPSSGRSSPIPRSTRGAVDEPLYKKDKGYRRYAVGVERTLALWDTAQQEWADYISFLGRLLKALQSHPSDIPVVPHSNIVALRLAQCLNPALPSGVHQKALELYAYIFSMIGSDALARHLTLYFPGLGSVLSFASLSVRPLYLSLFENHILKLDGSALRPALKAIILSLLPGLEDETSEDFERMASALEKLRIAVQEYSDEIADVKDSIGSSHFWQCFFLATITNASRRQGALAFLSSPELPADAEAAISPEPGLLIRCFESGLLDSQLLIQRGFLDLLVSHLPLDSPVLQQRINSADLERLVAAAAGVVSRRDMSLNRRLWAWFLGPEPTASEGEKPTSPALERSGSIDPSAHQAAFFSKYGLEALTNSVLKMISRHTTAPAERARPFRICLSLMDRWEVGGLIVPEIFVPALQSAQSYCDTAPKELSEEVMRSASAFFDGVDSGLIWGKLIHLITSSLQSGTLSSGDALRKTQLVKFVLARFNLREEDMLMHHMPLMVVSTLASLNDSFEKRSLSVASSEAIVVTLEIADSLIQVLPDQAVRQDQALKQNRSAFSNPTRSSALQQIRAFYEESQGSLDAVDPPFQSKQLGQLILREACHLFATSLRSSELFDSSDMPSRIFANALAKTQQFEASEFDDLITTFSKVLADEHIEDANLPFSHLSAITAVLSALQQGHPSTPNIPLLQLSELVHQLVRRLWHYLSPVMPKYHVEASRCILQLHGMDPSSRMVESAISTIIIQQTPKGQKHSQLSDASRRFSILWTHILHELNIQIEKRASVSRRINGVNVQLPSLPPGEFHSILTRPLLLLLDMLADEETETAVFMRNWLQDLPSLSKVFAVITIHIQNLRCLRSTNSLAPEDPTSRIRADQIDDTKECLYYLKHISNILRRPSRFTWLTLSEAPVPWVEQQSSQISIQEWLVRTCLQILSIHASDPENGSYLHTQELHRLSVSIITQILQSGFATQLRDLELEIPLIARLKTASPSLQSLLLVCELTALKLRHSRPQEQIVEARNAGQVPQRTRLSLTMNRDSVDHEPSPMPPPPQLVECLKFGFSSPSSRLVLDDWIQFLIDILPMYADAVFQSLLPLVECLCQQIKITYGQLKKTFTKEDIKLHISPETTLISLINGLEQILAKAHERLMSQETKALANKSPEQPQGFFSNVVSGVFTSETTQTRTPTANSRLSVLLCFQDTVRICFDIWSWGGYGQKQGQQDATSALSFGYTSLRMRNRARRILEHLFAAEALECLETLVVLWARTERDDVQSTAITGLLNVLNGSKPKHTIPAIFNAVYSRTDPGALDPNRLSTLTSDLADTELVAFLVEYTKSLEDDAMDEIWQDCTLFLRDVLANPLPHRQILPTLLEFTSVIGLKVDNTNFGEQKRMRKELADIFSRILTAIFTTRSMGYAQDGSQSSIDVVSTPLNGKWAQKRATDVVSILKSIVPKLSTILVENDRVSKVITDISTSVIGPTFRAKIFPDNVTQSTLDLLHELTKVAQGNKSLRKDIYDAFNDSKFFNSPLPLLEAWLPILAQWVQTDKERVLELLSRLSAPTTAGIMFGVGAASARQEADRKTQLTLRRIAMLLLASPEDAFTTNIPQMLEKIIELLTASPASSPSSFTRADVIILLRTIILKTSPIHLSSLWPVVNGELTSALSSLLPESSNKEHYNNAGIIQACKLLDQLVVSNPDEFQLMEWLFITDTIDAVYKPSVPPSILSLTDEINEVLSHASSAPVGMTGLHANDFDSTEPKRRLLLDPLVTALEKEEAAAVLDMTRGELISRVVRPFLGNLSMNAFEARYKGGDPDWQGLWSSIVKDAGTY